jgi:hypothetical protein
MPPTLHFLLSNSPVLVLIPVPQEIARFLPTLFDDRASFIQHVMTDIMNSTARNG